MKAVVVTGDRHAESGQWTEAVIQGLVYPHGGKLVPDLVIVGDATGIDDITTRVCGVFRINYVVVPAMWDRDGKGAGPKRNRAMLKILTTLQDHGYEAMVLAFHDDLWGSKGTKNCVQSALGLEFPVLLFRSDGSSEQVL